MAEHADEGRSEPQLQLQWLQQEVQRQREELDAVSSTLREQSASLEAMSAQLAVVMGSWRGAVRNDLGALIRQIDAGNDTQAQWRTLERQVERAQPEFALRAAEAGADLTPMESKVWMLMGMKLSTSEIASVLNQPALSITAARGRISRKLQRRDEPTLDATTSTRRRTTRRGGV